MDFMDWDSYLSLIVCIQDQKFMLKFMWYCVHFDFSNMLLEFGCFTDSMMGLTVHFFF